MRQMKEYKSLRKLYRGSLWKLKIPFFICLLIFLLAAPVGITFDNIPFEVTLAMLGMIFPVILFGSLWLISSIRTKKYLKKFTIHQLYRMDREAGSCEVCNGLLVTSQAVIRARFGLELVPVADIQRAYIDVNTGKLEGLIPIYKETILIFACRDYKQYSFRIKNNQEPYWFIQDELMKYREDIVFGYEEEP
ncbi:MAG: hypothetical protein NC517_11715 [Firmicutes bacterium]|nr:hypothetical protein [Bacillota bacterium]